MSKETPENLELTPTSEIKKLKEEREKGTLVELPSGIVVSIRKPDISKMLVEGEIPSELMSIAVGKENIDSLDPDGIKRGIELMNLMVKHSLVSPKAVDKDPKDGEILISDLSEEDKSFIVGEAQTEVGKLKPFRSERGKKDSS